MKSSQRWILLASLLLARHGLAGANRRSGFFRDNKDESERQFTTNEEEEEDESCTRRLSQPTEDTVVVQCSPKITEFLSYVAIQFIGDETELSCCEIPLLENGFVDVYDQLISSRCDEYFRGVKEVNLNINRNPNPRLRQQQSSRRAQQAAASNATSVPDGSSFFNVAGSCRNCPVSGSGSFNLYDDTFDRRALVATTSTQSLEDTTGRMIASEQQKRGIRRGLSYYDLTASPTYAPTFAPTFASEPQDNCTCPSSSVSFDYYGGAKIGPDAPTSEEFLNAFNGYIKNLVVEGLMGSITGIKNLEEYEAGPNGDIVRMD